MELGTSDMLKTNSDNIYFTGGGEWHSLWGDRLQIPVYVEHVQGVGAPPGCPRCQYPLTKLLGVDTEGVSHTTLTPREKHAQSMDRSNHMQHRTHIVWVGGPARTKRIAYKWTPTDNDDIKPGGWAPLGEKTHRTLVGGARRANDGPAGPD